MAFAVSFGTCFFNNLRFLQPIVFVQPPLYLRSHERLNVPFQRPCLRAKRALIRLTTCTLLSSCASLSPTPLLCVRGLSAPSYVQAHLQSVTLGYRETVVSLPTVHIFLSSPSELIHHLSDFSSLKRMTTNDGDDRSRFFWLHLRVCLAMHLTQTAVEKAVFEKIPCTRASHWL